jgi:two-component system, chemotaxis family, chemotaxis protein CheY
MKRILVVDDSPTIRRMMIASLKSLGDVEFDEADNGLEAIERLALAPVNLLFLDLNMPDIHGVEVIEFVRSHRAYSDIPICVVTTRGDEESRAQVLEAGANVYLTKPFTPQELVAQAKKLLAAV